MENTWIRRHGLRRFKTCRRTNECESLASICFINPSCRLDCTRLCCLCYCTHALACKVTHAYCSAAHLLWECHDVFLNATRAELCIQMTVLEKPWRNTVSARSARQLSLFCPQKIKATICILTPPNVESNAYKQRHGEWSGSLPVEQSAYTALVNINRSVLESWKSDKET